MDGTAVAILVFLLLVLPFALTLLASAWPTRRTTVFVRGLAASAVGLNVVNPPWVLAITNGDYLWVAFIVGWIVIPGLLSILVMRAVWRPRPSAGLLGISGLATLFLATVLSLGLGPGPLMAISALLLVYAAALAWGASQSAQVKTEVHG